MNCPRCSGPMETVTIDEVEVDRCTKCRGIWFDFKENEQLERKSRSLDIGKPGLADAGQAKIDCPHCKTKMVTMTVLDQPHIKYECCSVCFGTFFDAGEFKDASSYSLRDFFKRLRE